MGLFPVNWFKALIDVRKRKHTGRKKARPDSERTLPFFSSHQPHHSFTQSQTTPPKVNQSIAAVVSSSCHCFLFFHYFCSLSIDHRSSLFIRLPFSPSTNHAHISQRRHIQHRLWSLPQDTVIEARSTNKQTCPAVELHDRPHRIWSSSSSSSSNLSLMATVPALRASRPHSLARLLAASSMTRA